MTPVFDLLYERKGSLYVPRPRQEEPKLSRQQKRHLARKARKAFKVKEK